MATRIELSGRLTRKPEMRVTPAGTRYLRLEADCGDASSHLPLEIIMSGDKVAELVRQFHQEDRIQASGSLRPRASEMRGAGSIGIEVIADKITLVEKKQHRGAAKQDDAGQRIVNNSGATHGAREN